MATLLPVDGPPQFITPTNGRAFTAAELYALVGGHIETVPTRYALTGTVDHDLLMVINEDGKRLQLPVNRFASEMAMLGYVDGRRDDIVGNAVVCTREELGDEP
jgi:hypothetical protein